VVLFGSCGLFSSFISCWVVGLCLVVKGLCLVVVVLFNSFFCSCGSCVVVALFSSCGCVYAV
jgi:hypothetical protein